MDQNKKKSIKQERETAKEVGGRTTPASGAKWHSKADVKSDNYLIECKITEKQYYSLKLSTWEKINEEATKAGLRTPVIRIDLENGKHKLAVMACSDLQELQSNEANKKYYLWRVGTKVVGKSKSFRITALANCLGVDYSYDIVFFNVIAGTANLVVLGWLDFVNLVQECESNG